MNKNVLIIPLLVFILNLESAIGQCNADAGQDLSICDGDGSSSNYTYLDGTGSIVDEGEMEYEWTVLNEVGDDSFTLSV